MVGECSGVLVRRVFPLVLLHLCVPTESLTSLPVSNPPCHCSLSLFSATVTDNAAEVSPPTEAQCAVSRCSVQQTVTADHREVSRCHGDITARANSAIKEGQTAKGFFTTCRLHLLNFTVFSI